jgi:hypothetical protein
MDYSYSETPLGERMGASCPSGLLIRAGASRQVLRHDAVDGPEAPRQRGGSLQLGVWCAGKLSLRGTRTPLERDRNG